jgi:exodeoxyribonuclease VII large subunit
MLPTPSLLENTLVHSVSELNQMVGLVLSDGFPALKVTGEISNFACPRSGHWYFSLKDHQAQVRCVFFQAKKRTTHTNIIDGTQVVVTARLQLYETRGEFQLNIEALEPVGDGVLQRKFEALKMRLADEGLFESANKKPLPTVVSKVGLITSPTGAAIRDILIVLQRRFPAIEVVVYPTLVQGEEAASQIIQQIQIANQHAVCQVLLLTRGGGSLEDLWPFNEEKVARAIYDSQLPIVSAIGHEIDTTIADFVADVRAPTPSAAAELVSPDQKAWQQQLTQFEERLLYAIQYCLKYYQQRLLNLKRCLRHPQQRLQTVWQQLDELERRLKRNMDYHWDAKNQQLMHLARALETLNPLATLVRGYSLIKREADGSIIQDAKQVQSGDIIIAQLAKGKITCQVQDCLLVE